MAHITGDPPGSPSTPEPGDDDIVISAPMAGILQELHAPPERREVVAAFTAAALRRVAVAQLDQVDAVAVARSAAAAFVFVDERDPTGVAVRVVDRKVALDGLPATGSLVEVSSSDRQFLLTSIQAEITHLGLTVARSLHPIIGAARDASGHLVEIVPARDAEHRESLLQVELSETIARNETERIEAAIRDVLHDVYSVADDYNTMRAAVADAAVATASRAGGAVLDSEADEVAAFLHWLLDDNLVLLGTCTLNVSEADGKASSWGVGPDTERGLLADRASELGAELRALAGPDVSNLLSVTPTPLMSSVDRHVPIHCLDVGMPGPGGAITRAFRVVGIFTRKANSERAAVTPVLRTKLHRVLEIEDVVPGSHDEAALTSLFEMLPRDELFTATAAALGQSIIELLASGHEDNVRVMMHVEPANQTVSALVGVPHDIYTSSLRRRIERFMLAQLDGERVEVDVSLSDRAETVARFVVYVADADIPHSALASLERGIRVLCRTWEQDIELALTERIGPAEAATLTHAHSDRFPVAYRDTTTADVAADDVLEIKRLLEMPDGIHVVLRRDPTQSRGARLKVFTKGFAVELSRFLPIIESLGLWVHSDLPYDLGAGDNDLHLHDFKVHDPGGATIDVTRDGDRLARAALAQWAGRTEVDSLNRLVLTAGLTWADVSVLRAYRRFRSQVGTPYTTEYISECLVENPETARALIELFRARFDPEVPFDRMRIDALHARVVSACDAVERLDHDRILRGLLSLVTATLRSNRYFEPQLRHLAFKFDSSEVPGAPAPVPFREIFVYSPTMEGIHLRWGPVARGGIRWSDRHDDYRSEILDLMRAQVLKNALIVPTGAKGGFVIKNRPESTSVRDAVRAAYETFISGLLELTDNIVDDEVVPPPRRGDGDDPYLVVAADRGTAAFSDTANALSEARGFWLGDAFASGGSAGYDHKALGITARGAWVAVTQHFRELDIDVQTESISVAGIGDMSGDVFGSAMLCSEAIELVAAFDHRDIFIDPDPDPATAFAERRRLRETPRSSWQDYDAALISDDGGVWSRSMKSIELAPRARELLGLEDTALTPADLIKAILRAPVDLLFAGGIGTFVRASSEDDSDIIDRANAALRVSADEIRARVVGEGANLFITQRARVEFARRGGRINIDAVDNSAGVDISDHEVNIKILLRTAIAHGALAQDDRDTVLTAVTDEVVGQVLHDTALQTRVLSREIAARQEEIDALTPLLADLETDGVLDRDVEALPTSAEMATRRHAGAGFTRPELAVVMAGAKRQLAAAILDSDLPGQAATESALISYFPSEMGNDLRRFANRHRLRRELVASIVANDVVNHMGVTFAGTVSRETETGLCDVAAAYWLARSVADAETLWADVDSPEVASEPLLQRDLSIVVADLLAALTRDYLRTGDFEDIEAAASRDRATFLTLDAQLAEIGTDAHKRTRARRAQELRGRGLSAELAARFATLLELEMVPDVATLSRSVGRDVEAVGSALLQVSEAVGIDRVATRLQHLVLGDKWAHAARRALLDDLDDLRRRGTLLALESAPDAAVAEAVQGFLARRQRRTESLNRLLRSIDSDDADRLEVAAVVTRRVRGVVEGGD